MFQPQWTLKNGPGSLLLEVALFRKPSMVTLRGNQTWLEDAGGSAPISLAISGTYSGRTKIWDYKKNPTEGLYV